jgi:ribosomal protein L37AE/L43A
MRWGVHNEKGQQQAVWTITSFIRGKVIDRHYCFTCAKEAQTRHDGTIWSFKEQLEYREGKQKLDV